MIDNTENLETCLKSSDLNVNVEDALHDQTYFQSWLEKVLDQTNTQTKEELLSRLCLTIISQAESKKGCWKLFNYLYVLIRCPQGPEWQDQCKRYIKKITWDELSVILAVYDAWYFQGNKKNRETALYEKLDRNEKKITPNVERTLPWCCTRDMCKKFKKWIQRCNPPKYQILLDTIGVYIPTSCNSVTTQGETLLNIKNADGLNEEFTVSTANIPKSKETLTLSHIDETDTQIMNLSDNHELKLSRGRNQENYVQNTDSELDNYEICHQLCALMGDQEAFNNFIHKISLCKNMERFKTILDHILLDERQGVKENLIEYIAYKSTEAPGEESFDLAKFVRLIERDGMTVQKQKFLRELMGRISIYGKEGYRKARTLERDLCECKDILEKDICNALGTPLQELETQMVNLMDQEIPAKVAVKGLMGKMKDMYKALEKLGVYPLSNVETWLKQDEVPYDFESQILLGGQQPRSKVKLYSIGLRQSHGNIKIKSFARLVKNGEKNDI